MESFVAVVLVGAVFGLGYRLAVLESAVRRVDAKLDAALKALGVTIEDRVDDLPDHVKVLAADPRRKIDAIKALREATGAGLAEAKVAVEAYQRSLEG